jgi:predicted dehydrogenase
MKKIKVGIVGAGFVAAFHIEALSRLGNVEVTAISDHVKELAQNVGLKYGISKTFDDFDKMLNDEEIEAIHICTPNYLHYEMVKKVIEHGKHVVCEKPLAMNSVEAKELVDKAKKKGITNAVSYNMRFYPMVQQVKAMVEDGEIGDIYLVHGTYLQDWLFFNTDYNWRVEATLGGESRVIADIGTHWFDMAQYTTGKRINRVMADFSTFIPVRKKPLKKEALTFTAKREVEEYEEVNVDTEDHGTVLLRFDGNTKGVFTGSQVCAGRKNYLTLEINGSKQSLVWCQEDANKIWIGRRERENGVAQKDFNVLKPKSAVYAMSPGGLGEGYPDTFKNLFRNVYGTLEGEKENGDYPAFIDGYEEIALVEAIIRSSKEEKWIDVK